MDRPSEPFSREVRLGLVLYGEYRWHFPGPGPRAMKETHLFESSEGLCRWDLRLADKAQHDLAFWPVWRTFYA